MVAMWVIFYKIKGLKKSIQANQKVKVCFTLEMHIIFEISWYMMICYTWEKGAQQFSNDPVDQYVMLGAMHNTG